MRQAMAEAEVGDDVMGEDPTVNELQRISADMFGMEAALFVPTGTMSNLIAVMVHCRERDDEMIVGDVSHIHIYEQGGSAQLAGVHANTGGRVLPLTFLQEVRALADRYGLSVHMDGARVMNAAVAQGVHPQTILQHTHTVSVCLSKGLGAPVGTMLAGPKDFIARALRCRKALGGGMRQAGVLAAAGKVSLLDMVGRLEEDHRNARTFAQALLDFDPLFAVDMATVETNILRFYLKEPGLSPAEFCARMVQVGEGEEVALGQGVQVLILRDRVRRNMSAVQLLRVLVHVRISAAAEDFLLQVEKGGGKAQVPVMSPPGRAR
ncbi:unnamed protein product [Pleuronectes platessa]|uniref:Aromatic amino acid beta-eliminating lyase/threonine aldolase domain-containing protein n=1 Tax=Pleuronectes platessa TaxID=8262 RepID=A0A9N7TJ26_PLEPL|nr:unnamed protein product [Pleuronectes platessa]